MDLSRAFGGGDYNIPSNVTLELENAIGKQYAIRLVKWGGGSRIYVPAMALIEREIRRKEVKALREQGLTLREIAKQYRYIGRYTERQIWAILNR